MQIQTSQQTFLDFSIFEISRFPLEEFYNMDPRTIKTLRRLGTFAAEVTERRFKIAFR